MELDLKQQIATLDAALLRQIDTTFPDPLQNSDRALINAYLILSHSILEEYIEDEFEAYIRRVGFWLTPPLPNEVPSEVAQFCFYVGAGKGSLDGYSRSGSFTLLKAALAENSKKIHGNNGIKAHNIQDLARTSGIEWTSFEASLSTLLADLDTLGAKRGEAGHLSPFTTKSMTLTGQRYPEQVRIWVDDARVAAESIGGYLRNLRERPTTDSSS